MIYSKTVLGLCRFIALSFWIYHFIVANFYIIFFLLFERFNVRSFHCFVGFFVKKHSLF